MHEPLHDALQPVMVRWTMGGQAAQLAPDGLREKLGEDADEAELRLLVVAGQALGTLVVPEPSGDLQILPDLPALALPTMPDRLRPLAARIMARNDDWTRGGLLRLLENRGCVVHPSDWMPSRTGDVPDVYAPWQDWMTGIAADAGPSSDPAHRWDDLGTAGRRAMLSDLRRADPSAARDLISARMPGRPSEQRLWMTEALSRNLSEDDRELLQFLAKDRAPTVRTTAIRLMARLGTAPASTRGDADPAADVADFLRVETTGVLRRGRTLALAPMRSQPQRTRFYEMLKAIDAGTLATALGIGDADLPAMWPWNQDGTGDVQFCNMILTTGSDAVVAAFEAAVVADERLEISMLREGVERLSPSAVATLANRSYVKAHTLPVLVQIMPVLGVVDDHAKAPLWRSLAASLQREDVQARAGTEELLAMGLLLTAPAARTALDRIAALGVPSADPRLDALRINAAL